MPRFLNTRTGEFEWHDPESTVYAILSHTWRSDAEGGEQSYDDVRALQAVVTGDLRKRKIAVVDELKALEIPTPSLIPRVSNILAILGSTPSWILCHPRLSDKIKGVCKVAREAGYRLVWNDACCIDKSSSAELSEAINSMYDLYRLSQICYVYLEDVSDRDVPGDKRSDFRESRWHTRGWTLQELIAPKTVEFLTETWRLLGTKIGLAATLAEITGVDFSILTGQVTVHSASVARRMSWAAYRETTRIEDRAYSLMGIFGIHMSPIYGEGDNAFLRLQEEIVRTIPDQSIFAWGSSYTLPQTSQNVVTLGVDYYYWRDVDSLGHHPGLVASDPDAFGGGANITPIAPSVLASRLRLKRREDIPSLHCAFTPQGVRVRLLSLNVAALSALNWTHPARPSTSLKICSDCSHLKADTLGLLQCEDESGSLIALPLGQHQEDTAGSGRGLFVGTYITCHRCPQLLDPFTGTRRPYRTVRLTKVALAEILEHVIPELIEVSILRYHPKYAPTEMIPVQTEWGVGTRRSIKAKARRIRGWLGPVIKLWPAGDRDDPAAFRIPPGDIEALRILGFVAKSPLQVLRSDKKITVRTSLAFNCGANTLRSRECPQNIELTLTLTRNSDLANGISMKTKAQFSIVNSFGVLTSDDSVSTSYLDTLGEVSGPIYALKTAPCVDPGSEGHSPRLVLRRRSTGDCVVANAEFTLCSDTDRTKNTRKVRFLRVSLEFPSESVVAARNPCDLLWLSVQVSETYSQYTRDIVDMVMPSDVLPSQNGDISGDGAPSQPSSGDSSHEAEAMAVSSSTSRTTAPTLSVAESEQPEGSVTVVSRGVSPQAPPPSKTLPTSSQVSEPPRCTSLIRADVPDNGTAVGGPSITIPCNIRPRISSERPQVDTEPGGRSSQSASPLPWTSSTQPEEARKPVYEDFDPTHEERERSDVRHPRENDALQAQVSTLQARVADLMSSNAELLAQNAAQSAQMAAILARLDAPESARQGPTGRRGLAFSKAHREGRCVIQ